MRKSVKIALPCLAIVCVALFAGCKMLDVVTQAGTSVAVATGAITPGQAESINKSSAAVGKVFENITPEQEYYLGRSVAAVLFKTYKPSNKQDVNHYLNVIGQTLAMFSDRPETFGGYRFMVMDTDEINAFAAPGGLIMVSKGLLRCCKNEDELAAVLAHEIAHVQHCHALGAISKSRWTGAVTTLLAEAGKQFGPAEVAELTKAFEGCLSDMVGTLVNSGYSRKLETEADKSAVIILKRMGYNPVGLKNMLEEMARVMPHDNKGFAKTHPDPKVRITDLEPLLVNCGPILSQKARDQRFKSALAGM